MDGSDAVMVVAGGFAVMGIIFFVMVRKGLIKLPQFSASVKPAEIALPQEVSEIVEEDEDEEIKRMVSDCLPPSSPGWTSKTERKFDGDVEVTA